MKKPMFALILALALLVTACAAPGQAPETSPGSVPEPESPSSVSEPAPEPEAPESSSQPEPDPEPEPEPAPESSQPDVSQQNPDTALIEEDPNRAAVIAKSEKMIAELEAAMPKDLYGTMWASVSDGPTACITLNITTPDEAALDKFLEGWTGTKWDFLRKRDVPCSLAEAEDLAKKAAGLGYDFGPGTVCKIYESVGYVEINVAYPKNEDVIFSLPEEFIRLAEEAGVSKEIYRYFPTVNGERPSAPAVPGINPDT